MYYSLIQNSKEKVKKHWTCVLHGLSVKNHLDSFYYLSMETLYDMFSRFSLVPLFLPCHPFILIVFREVEGRKDKAIYCDVSCESHMAEDHFRKSMFIGNSTLYNNSNCNYDNIEWSSLSFCEWFHMWYFILFESLSVTSLVFGFLKKCLVSCGNLLSN